MSCVWYGEFRVCRVYWRALFGTLNLGFVESVGVTTMTSLDVGSSNLISITSGEPSGVDAWRVGFIGIQACRHVALPPVRTSSLGNGPDRTTTLTTS